MNMFTAEAIANKLAADAKRLYHISKVARDPLMRKDAGEMALVVAEDAMKFWYIAVRQRQEAK